MSTKFNLDNEPELKTESTTHTKKLSRLNNQIEKLEYVSKREAKNDSFMERFDEICPGFYSATICCKTAFDGIIKTETVEVQGLVRKTTSAMICLMESPLPMAVEFFTKPANAVKAGGTAVVTAFAKAHNARTTKAKAKLEFLKAKRAELTNESER